ncbi:kinase-like domain-containing protein [Leptodontidium sp. MPI-SDFR-AT-0119]|nr:kinase-like domain-containing protein [Leptodontidium sp. MPI-SDFR-AT-0119]
MEPIIHAGSEALAINNTYFRRFLSRLALHTTAKLFRQDGPCIPISRHKILKNGFSVHLTEAVTMDYVARNTSIPVPKVHCSFIHKNRAYIIMERIQGKTLAAAWPHLSKDSLQKIFLQLKNMIKELRALKPPPEIGVASCAGGSMYDSQFHRWLRAGLDETTRLGDHVSDEDTTAIKAMIVKQDGTWPAPVFTHSDLNPFNILVRGDQIVSIIDWEFSGWYPPYWEYTSAWFGNVTRGEWQSTIYSLLNPYPEELEIERTRNR